MHTFGLLCAVVSLAHIWTVNANVEKTIFLGPSPVIYSNVHPGFDDLRLDTLDPAHLFILATDLPVQFPSSSAPHGLESWYILRGLEEGRRYEVRICWPATQPTHFWLDTYSIAHVFDTPTLISFLAEYSDKRQVSKSDKAGTLRDEAAPAESILFLRVQAAAAYYSLNRTLMEHPLPVDVDIILDPFILNVLPRSLGPTAIYISIVAVGAWFLSGYVYRWLLSIADELPSKDHAD